MMLVALGGAIGSAGRYLVSGALSRPIAEGAFPAGTLVVNVAGCFAAGLILGLNAQQDALSESARLLLLIGVLGGFTTFSAFGVETVMLARRGDPMLAVLNVTLSVAAGLFAVWLGLVLMERS
jgi:CrcB protein